MSSEHPVISSESSGGGNTPAQSTTATGFNLLPVEMMATVLQEDTCTLTELVHKAFVNTRWTCATTAVVDVPARTSLKLFECERNLFNYKQYVIEERKLHEVDPRFELHITGRWQEEDHIYLREFTHQPVCRIECVLAQLFPKTTNLVLNTSNIDEVRLLSSMPALTTLTLIELPDSRKLQEQIWTALAETCTELRHLHIFHMQSEVPLSPEHMAPVLSQLETLTLDRYKHENLLEIIRCLTPNSCRTLQLGPFYGDDRYQKMKDFETTVRTELPLLWSGLVNFKIYPFTVRLHDQPEPNENHQQRVLRQHQRRAEVIRARLGIPGEIAFQVEEQIDNVDNIILDGAVHFQLIGDGEGGQLGQVENLNNNNNNNNDEDDDDLDRLRIEEALLQRRVFDRNLQRLAAQAYDFDHDLDHDHHHHEAEEEDEVPAVLQRFAMER